MFCAALAIGLGLALPAAARTFCCTDKAGHKVCGDTLPEQCGDRAYKEYDVKGVRSVDAPLTPEQKVQRDAEAARKKEQERLAAEQRRKDRALLDTYSSEKDIDAMRERALRDIEASNKQTQDKYDAAVLRKRKLDKELEFYVNKPVPASLKAQIKENDSELAGQQKSLEDRKKEVDAVKTRFEEDRKRYRELMQGSAR
ncbi:MAG TPA: hypothetical protein VF816_01680 [Rhodocyclaceae bacterium]